MQSDHLSAHQCSRNTCKHKCNLIMCFLINAVWSLANTYAAWSFVCTSMQCIHVPPHQCCLITCKHQCSLFMCLHINAVWSCANVNAVWTSEQCLLNNAVWSCVCTVMLSDHARPRTYSCAVTDRLTICLHINTVRSCMCNIRYFVSDVNVKHYNWEVILFKRAFSFEIVNMPVILEDIYNENASFHLCTYVPRFELSHFLKYLYVFVTLKSDIFNKTCLLFFLIKSTVRYKLRVWLTHKYLVFLIKSNDK